MKLESAAQIGAFASLRLVGGSNRPPKIALLTIILNKVLDRILPEAPPIHHVLP